MLFLKTVEGLKEFWEIAFFIFLNITSYLPFLPLDICMSSEHKHSSEHVQWCHTCSWISHFFMITANLHYLKNNQKGGSGENIFLTFATVSSNEFVLMIFKVVVPKKIFQVNEHFLPQTYHIISDGDMSIWKNKMRMVTIQVLFCGEVNREQLW